MERRDGLTESFAEKWIADRGASFHMTHSADQLSDVRFDNKVRIGDNHVIDIDCGLWHAHCGIPRKSDC